MNLSPSQIRAARAGIDWTQLELAERARVHVRTIKQLERGRVNPQAGTQRRIANTFAKAGIQFSPDGRALRLPLKD